MQGFVFRLQRGQFLFPKCCGFLDTDTGNKNVFQLMRVVKICSFVWLELSQQSYIFVCVFQILQV